MSRRYARSLGGSRACDAIPLNRGKTTTIISSLRLDGTTVPVVIAGAMNGNTFRNFVEQHLAPRLYPGDIVVKEEKNQEAGKLYIIEIAHNY